MNIKGFVTPEPTERPLRVLVYGLSKQGKSHFVFTATEVGPLYWIDSERGSDFYPPENGYGFQVAYTSDPEFVIKTLQQASREAANGDGLRPIVAIDSMSSIWFQQQEVAEQLRTSGYGNFRAWGPAKKPLKKLYDLMMKTSCHVIITARAKEDYEVDSKGTPKLQGLKPDVERNLAFAVDHLLLLYTNEEKDGKLEAEDYYGRVMGTRSPEEAGESHVPMGRVFKNPRFSDLLVAHLKGAPPTGIEDTAGAQVQRQLRAPKTYRDLVARMSGFGWSKEEVSDRLKEQFGAFDQTMLPEYWEYLEGVAEDDA